MGMKNSKIYTKGFTLIELLVVIAIIGLLSAIVMASLSGARSKGNDASVESNLNNIVTQSLVSNYSPLTITFSGVSSTCGSNPSSFSSDSIVQKQITAAYNSASNKTIYCLSNGSYWAVSALMSSPKNTGDYWCVDSDGFRGEVLPGSNTGLNTTNNTCNK
jgi:prepilin-type N-terminal cleavage/methylation domain-containing protein